MIQVTMPKWNAVLHYTEVINAPKHGGCYVIYSNNDEVLYVGKAENLHARLYKHFSGGYPRTGGLAHYFYKCAFFFEDNPMYRDMYETYLINVLQPKFNDQKTYLYKPEKPVRAYKHRGSVENAERIESMTCKGSKWNGDRCNKRVKLGESFCAQHIKQAAM